MEKSPSAALAHLLLPLLLVGCSDEQSVTKHETGDPLLDAALSEPILIDPDLLNQNLANSAIDVPDPEQAVPEIETGPAAIAAARAAALAELGGPDRLKHAPRQPGNDGGFREIVSISPACADALSYSAEWATRLPLPLPVFPRAAVREAAGAEVAGCSVRIVAFATPVPEGEVLDYYFTRAANAGYTVALGRYDGAKVLWGKKGQGGFALYLRPGAGTTSEVDLVTVGL